MTETNQAIAEANETILRNLSAKASVDPAFRRRLESDPGTIFAKLDLDLPAGTHFVCTPATPQTAAEVVARSTETEIHLPIIEGTDGAQAEGALSDEQLEQVSGGGPVFGILGGLAWGAYFALNLAGKRGLTESASNANKCVEKMWNNDDLI